MALALSITAPVAVVLCLVVWRSVWLTILVYQVGICLLVPALMVGGILAAGLLWGWLRQRSGSVWPALLGHWGAVAAYAAVYQQIVIP